jgi:phosphoribosylglycinamide formyltransferase-1
VHFVDEAVDHGVIILQKTIPVQDEDTVESLSARILEQEHVAYAEGIARVLSGLYRVQGRRYVPVGE